MGISASGHNPFLPFFFWYSITFTRKLRAPGGNVLIRPFWVSAVAPAPVLSLRVCARFFLLISVRNKKEEISSF